jgi:hypothetical protein
MKLKITSFITALILCFMLIHCKDNEEPASIIGGWHGEHAEFTINLIPVSESNFDFSLTFSDDGKVIYSEDTASYSGTFTLTGKELIISGVEVKRIPVSLSGTYHVKELTSTRLIIEGEREGQISDATYGNFTGTVKVKLTFSKI